MKSNTGGVHKLQSVPFGFASVALTFTNNYFSKVAYHTEAFKITRNRF